MRWVGARTALAGVDGHMRLALSIIRTWIMESYAHGAIRTMIDDTHTWSRRMTHMKSHKLLSICIVPDRQLNMMTAPYRRRRSAV